MVYAPFWGSRLSTIFFKYLSQTLQTLWLLLRKRPKVVFVMSPPSVASFPVWLYCLLFRASYVIDAHTGAFIHPRWERMQWLQRFFSRRAVTTIVTNRHLQRHIEAWNAPAKIVTDVPVCFAEAKLPKLDGACNMVLVSSFDIDEPTAEFLAAAGRVPEVSFYVTGNSEKLPRDMLATTPENVHYTGFLDDGEFVGLMMSSDAVLALTTRDHTMQRAAYEAIYLERPVITSDFGILRDAFPKATIHVRPTADAIEDGIREMIVQKEQLEREAVELKEDKLCRWEVVAQELLELVGLAEAHPPSSHEASTKTIDGVV